MQEFIIELVHQYGPLGVLLGGSVILLLWLFNNKISKSNKTVTTSVDKLATAILEQNTKLSDTISNTIVKTMSENNKETQKQMLSLIEKAVDNRNNKKEEQHFDYMKERINISDEIYTIIKEINDKSRAARTILFEFHNSNSNFEGLPFVKYDATTEHIARGEKTLMNNIKDSQLQILFPVIKSLYNNESNIIHYNGKWIHDDLYNISAVLYSQYNEIQIEDVIYVGCYSKKNQMIGVIAVEFNKHHPYVKGNVQDDEIVDAAEQISTLLRLREK